MDKTNHTKEISHKSSKPATNPKRIKTAKLDSIKNMESSSFLDIAVIYLLLKKKINNYFMPNKNWKFLRIAK